MPEETHPLPPAAPSSDPIPEPAEATPEPPLDPRLDLGPGPGINIGEEFGTAKRNLPPAKIVGIVLAAAAVLVGIFAFLDRAKPQGGGSVDNIAVAEIPNQNAVLVAVNVTVNNSGKKPLWIHDIKATLKTDGGEFSAIAALLTRGAMAAAQGRAKNASILPGCRRGLAPNGSGWLSWVESGTF